jgi:hypothetical protein
MRWSYARGVDELSESERARVIELMERVPVSEQVEDEVES